MLTRYQDKSVSCLLQPKGETLAKFFSCHTNFIVEQKESYWGIRQDFLYHLVKGLGVSDLK